MRAYENFASVGRLEVLSTLNFSEATSGHPEFFVPRVYLRKTQPLLTVARTPL